MAEEKMEIISLASDLAGKDFGLEKSGEHKPSRSLLLNALAKRIEEMLATDFERLMQIFYRIDLDEQKVNEAVFTAESPAHSLAEMVLEREIQKAKFRVKYS